MKKVIIVGFSVTEMPSSYIPIVNEKLAQRNINLTIDKCGIGGITTESLAYIVEDILSKYSSYDAVIFEVATSYVRDVYNQHMSYNDSYMREIWIQIEKLVLTAKRFGLRAGFLNLPRKDVGYENDYLENIIAQVSSRHRSLMESVSVDLALRGIDLDSILFDVVHPTALGAEIYSERAIQLACRLVAEEALNPATLDHVRYNSLKFSDYIADQHRVFSRHGFCSSVVTISEGQKLSMKLENPQDIEGFAVLCGPTSGDLIITTDKRRHFLCYDQHCYYERLMTSVQPLGKISEITIELSSEVPDIPLIKGNKDYGERSMGLMYLFTA